MQRNKFVIAAFCFATSTVFAADQEKLPSIYAGTAPTTVKKSEKKSNFMAPTHVSTLIAQARTEVAFDSSCVECVSLAQNKLLTRQPNLTPTHHILDLIKTIPQVNYQKAVARFQQESDTLRVSKADIRRACGLWKHKPTTYCAPHTERKKK